MSKRRTRKGDGSAYQRGGVWWIQYRFRGEQVREPGGFDGRGARTKTEAEEKLRQRLAEIHTDRYTGPEAERITVEALLDAYLAHLETRGAKAVAAVRSRASLHVQPFFDGARAVDVTTARLREFIADKTAAGLAPASVNRCLQDLRAAFHLARKEERLARVPYFPLLREDNARRGFFERAEHEAVKANLPEPYSDVAEFGYRTGWRRGEILPLAWEDVDREGGTVILRDSKNSEGRTFPLREAGALTELGQLLEKRWTLRACETAKGPAVSRYVFHVGGRRVWDFDSVWRKGAEAANLPGRLFHDYRRTAVRDLIRAGVPQAVAMTMTGHKTDAVFRRYNITSDADKVEAVRKLSTYRAGRTDSLNVVRFEKAQIEHKGTETSPEVSETA